MSKYQPLGVYLSRQNRSSIPMTFAEIERVLGQALPSSKMQRAWWSNNPANNVMTRQWLSAGYETVSVDIAAGKLVFRRIEEDKAEEGNDGELSDPLFGCMKGTMTIPADLDLTAPVDPEWGRVYEDG